MPKKLKKLRPKWMSIPQQDWKNWFAEWAISNLMLITHQEKKGFPKRIKFLGVKERPKDKKHPAELQFNVEW